MEVAVEHKKGYKKNKLGWIPEDWGFKRIDSFAKTSAGGTPSTKVSAYWNGDVPWMSSGDLNMKIIQNVDGRITELGLKESSAKMVPINSILIGLAGQGKTRGTIAINKIELSTNQSVAYIIPTDGEVYYQYLYHNLDSRYSELRRLSTGDGGRGGLNLKLINGIKIPIPSPPEQKAIAKCLNTWDIAIQDISELIDQKALQKKGLMQQLLAGKTRLKGFDYEWVTLRLSDISERVKRKNAELNDTVVTISAQRGFVLQEDFFNKRVASKTLSNYTLVHKGEYCYNKSYSNGYPMGAFKRLDDFEKAVVTTLYTCFKLKDNVDSNFINQFFEGGYMIQGLRRVAQEGGRAHGLLNIGLKDFFGLELTIPNKKEQTAIANVLQIADKEIKLLKQKRYQLKEQKKGLMQQLLTGKKRLKF